MLPFRDGLCYRAYGTGQGFEYCVNSYEDLLRDDWKGTLRIPVTEEEMGSCSWDTLAYKSGFFMDEASGRVVIWVGDGSQGRCYVGDLV